MNRLTQIMPVNWLLLAIGLTDLITTLFWLGTGRAIEVNPVMATVLNLGLFLFVAIKLGTLGAYVGVMEWYRRRRSAAFAQRVGNFTVFAYLCIYTVSFCSVNHNYLFG